MAITAQTLDNCKRTLHYRLNAQQVPIALPWDLVDIDGAQYYEPVDLARVTNGRKQRGAATGVVYLPRVQGVPLAGRGSTPVFLVTGV